MADVLTIDDLIADKKHSTFFAEVVTGKAGGLSSGSPISTSINQVTGQVQKTIPAIAQTAETEHDNQMQSFEDDFDSRLAGMAFTRVGTFTDGATITDMRQTLLWAVSQGGDGHEYGWTGAFPKVVSAGSTPTQLGAGAWVDRTDVTLRTEITASITESMRRSYAEAGYTLVPGSFETGGTVTTATDVLLYGTEGKAYSWGGTLPKTVPVGSTPRVPGGIGLGAWIDQGDSLLRNRVSASVDTIANLRSINKFSFQRAFVAGYYAAGDGGGGNYWYDQSDTTSADNGGTVIVAADGGRWKLILTTDVTVKQFGAKGDNVTNDFSAFQAAVTWGMNNNGATVFVPDGTYKIIGQISQDRSADATLGVVSIVGAGRNSVFINHTGSTPLFYVTGHDTAAEGQTKGIRVAGMTLLGSATTNSSALGFTLVSFPVFEDLEIQGFDYGFYFQDVDHVSWNASQIRFNNHAGLARKNPVPVTNSTMPNQYTFNEIHIGANFYSGLFNVGGSAWAFSGGSIERNGGSNPSLGFGLRCENCGYEGGAIVTMSGTYVESNNGLADIVLTQTLASAPVLTQSTYNFVGVSFNRASATMFGTNVILTNFDTVANVGEQVINLVGCTFKSLGGYVPNAGRPYLNWSGAQKRVARNFSALGTIFEDSVEAPTFVQNITKPFLECSKLANQSINNATPTVWLIDNVNAGFSWSTSINGAFQVPIPETGNYQFTASLTFSTPLANTQLIEILKGSSVMANNSISASNVLSVSCQKYCTAGELISVRVTQNSGGSATLVGSGAAISYLNIQKLVDF